jgi:hypothetical protein
MTDAPTRPPDPPSDEPIEPPLGCPQEVIDLFENLTLHLVNTGWTRYSARAILHRIRWHFAVERGMRDFKCNNNWTPTLARWVMQKHPGTLENFFELRRSPGTVPVNGDDDDD